MMVDITHKNNTLRMATAQAIVQVGQQETIEAIKSNKVPKGDVFEMSRAAGLLAIKKTPELLPDCHPLPIEYASFQFNIEGLNIIVQCTIKTIYKTGVEVEAMMGASIVALNMYDMLKPIDKNVEIHQIKLLQKSGGKTDAHPLKVSVRAAVIVCSDSISAGEKEDGAGVAIVEILKKYNVQVPQYVVIPDDVDRIRELANKYHDDDISLIIFTGGTGLSARDQTPEAIRPLLDKTIPGMEEAIRSYGQQRTPYAMFSRSVVGMMGNTLVMTLPGSTKGAVESMQAVFPFVLHLFDTLAGEQHSA